MTILFTILHVLVCLFLILVVLAQQGKGQDLASAFGGGGSQTAFGARGTATLLSKITAGAAVLFVVTSLTLSYLRPAVSNRSVVPESPEASEPSSDAPPAEAAPTSTPPETPPATEGSEPPPSSETTVPPSESDAPPSETPPPQEPPL